MSLDADLDVVRGTFRLRTNVRVLDGEVVAVLGPNGAGKSTMLRALAGLLALDAGIVRVDATVLDEPATGTFVGPERRPVGMVFQDYLLFPHLTARDNVAFGLRARGMGRTAARERADAALAGLGLADEAGRRPRALSGGQAQRVALARALVTSPRLMLLDEPLAALDAGVREQVRVDLRQQLAAFGGATVIVTHDPLDAFVLADRLVVLEDGALVQVGPPAAVARRPRTDYGATLVGLNLYRGVADGALVRLDGAVVSTAHPMTGPALVAFAPASVTVHRSEPHGSARNCWPVTVSHLERHAETVRVRLAGPLDLAADLTALSVAELGLEPGVQVWAAVKATETSVYPA